MQADHWTNQEVERWNQHIDALGVSHASMRAGDVLDHVADRVFT